MESLQTRMTLTIIGLALGPLLALGVMITWQTYSVQKSQAIDLERETALRVVHEVNGFVNGLVSELETALNTMERGDIPLERQEAVLANILSNNYYYDRIILTNADGREIIHQNRLNILKPGEIGDTSELVEFLQPITTGKAYYGPVTFDSFTGEPSMIISIPQISPGSGRPKRVLIAYTRWKKIWLLFGSLAKRPGEDVYLLDRDGRLVAHRNPSLVLRGTTFKPAATGGIAPGLEGKDVIIAAEKLAFGDQAFQVVAERSLIEALSLAWDTAIITLIFIGALLIIAVTLIILVVGSIIRPVRKLAEAAREIENGDLNKRVEVLQYDEIGDLAHAFNNMTARLSYTLNNLEREIKEHERDLDSLRASEERFRQLAENIQEVFWVVSPDWNEVYYISPGYEQVWGRTCQSLYESPKSWIDAIPGEDRAAVYEYIESKQRGDLDSILFPEYRVVRPDGTVRWILARGFPVKNAEGNTYRVAGIAEDITDRKLAEKEKSRLENRLRQSQKMEAIGTLAGGIAHDFNNILSAIIGFNELALLDLPNDGQISENLRQSVKAGARAKRLVQQILAFSRKASQEKKPIDPAEIVREVLMLLRASFPASIDIRSNIPENLGLVMADATQIHQVIMNLCTNASQAMQKYGGELSITLTRTHLEFRPENRQLDLPPGDYLILSISDTGIGMDERTMERIFEPFFTTKATGQGTGMGLAVAHGIVESHGGRIRAVSEPGKGSTFRIFLPVTFGVRAKNIQEDCVIQEGSERILFVDDEEDLALLGRKALERMGYRVEAFTDSQAALELFQNNADRFDLVITDMTMPRINGLDLADRMLNIRPDIPVILCSGYTEALPSDECRRPGIKAFLSKPLTMRVLADAIRNALD